MELPDDIKPGKEWIVTAAHGLQAKKLSGGFKSVQIPQNERLIIIHGDARKPDHPENTVCFPAADENDKTKIEHYWCYLHEFQKRCKIASELEN
jgi:hypothetical protein